MKKKIVYIAHPIGGDVQANIAFVLDIIKKLNMSNSDIVPFAPYIVDCLAMDDNIPKERQRGISNNIALIKSRLVDEIWLYGNRISPGMDDEIALAEYLGIPVISMSPHINYVKSNRISINDVELFTLRQKAEKWDALDDKLSKIYGDGEDSDDDETDLTTIGEIAAQAFGYL